PPFTWHNNRDPPAFVQEQIDRAIANEEWMSLFGRGPAHHIPTSKSNHPITLVVLQTLSSHRKKGKPPFCF
ncbi:hypothetical protein FCV25MIE_28850, partial [Fagus crenata]